MAAQGFARNVPKKLRGDAMSSLRKRDEFKFPILSKEMILRDEESQKPSEVKVYYLSPEELEKYRKGVNDMSIMKKLEEKYPDLESLMKSMEGKSVKEWEAEHGVQNSYFYYLKKKYIERGDKAPEQKPTKEIQLKKLEELKKLAQAREDIGVTPPQESEGKQETEMGEKETAGALIVSRSGLVVQEFANLHEALNYIENHVSKSEAQRISLYKRVPFSFGVNVVPGEVS